MNLEIMLFISKFNSPLLLSLIVIFGFFLMGILGSLSDWLFPLDPKIAKEKNKKFFEEHYYHRAKKFLEIELLEKKIEKLSITGNEAVKLRELIQQKERLKEWLKVKGTNITAKPNKRELEILEELKQQNTSI